MFVCILISKNPNLKKRLHHYILRKDYNTTFGYTSKKKKKNNSSYLHILIKCLKFLKQYCLLILISLFIFLEKIRLPKKGTQLLILKQRSSYFPSVKIHTWMSKRKWSTLSRRKMLFQVKAPLLCYTFYYRKNKDKSWFKYLQYTDS